MFRKRIILVKIDTTGLDTDGAIAVTEHMKNIMKQSWWDRLWTQYFFMPSYKGDTSDMKRIV